VDHIQFLGFTQIPPSGGLTSAAYISTLVPLKEQGTVSDDCHSQILETEVDAHHLDILASFHIELIRQRNKPVALFLVEFGGSLFDSSFNGFDPTTFDD
jgi:hypothetical protein